MWRFEHETAQDSEGLFKLTTERKEAGDAALIVAERIVSVLSQFIVFILAARILGPAEFGQFALVSACAILLLSLAEVGWAPFIMSQGADTSVPKQVLFIAILNGTAVGAMGILAAISSSLFGVSTEIIDLMILFSVWVMIANASSVQKGILNWMGKLKAAAACEVAGDVVGSVVAIFSLYRGDEIFALVYGRLSSQVVILAMSISITRFLPKSGMSGSKIKELWIFSSQIFVSRMLSTLRLQFVTFIIGGFLGATSVGYYRAAERLVGSVSELIFVPAYRLAWMQLRNARDAGPFEEKGKRVNAQFGKSLKLLIIFGAPAFLWLILVNEQLVIGMFGEEWQPAAALVAILSLGALLRILSALTEPLLSIVGEAQRLPRFAALLFVLTALVTLIAVNFEIQVVAWSQVMVSAISLVVTMSLFSRYASIVWLDVATTAKGIVVPLLIGVSVIFFLEGAMDGRDLPPVVVAIGLGLAGLSIYLFSIAFLDRTMWKQIKSWFLR